MNNYINEVHKIVRQTKHHKITLVATGDDTPIRGNLIDSGDDEVDRAFEDEMLGRMHRGDIWAWATVTIQVELKDGTQSEIECLSGCSYKDSNDFIKNSGYYQTMVEACFKNIEDAQEELEYLT